MNPQPAPLAYRIKGIPLVAAQYFPLFTDKKTLSRQPPRRDFTLQERTVIQRAEAYPYTVLLGGDTRKPTPGSIGARFLFRHIPHREQHALQDVLFQSPQKESLVLVPVRCRSDITLFSQEGFTRIMPGGNPINPLFIGYSCQKRPFQFIVAERAGDRSMPRQVFIDKVADDAFAEKLPRIVCNMLNAQPRSQCTRIVQILRPAVHLVKTESNSRHLITGILQSHGSHRAVRTAAHSQ